MIVFYLLALAWIAFVFAVCVGEFFEVEFRSLGVGFNPAVKAESTRTQARTLKKAA